jgi:hypothetical protein
MLSLFEDNRWVPPRELVLASAGSGKTFRISSGIIALIARGEAPDDIFASTFTRKAAGEILDRVLLRLALASLEPKEARELAVHAELIAADAPASAAKEYDCTFWARVLQRSVRRLHRMNIGTLDAFFLRIVSSFGHELGMPVQWDIGDEATSTRLRSLALQDVLRNHDPAVLLPLIRSITRNPLARSLHEGMLRKLKTLVAVHHALDARSADHWSGFDAEAQGADEAKLEAERLRLADCWCRAARADHEGRQAAHALRQEPREDRRRRSSSGTGTRSSAARWWSAPAPASSSTASTSRRDHAFVDEAWVLARRKSRCAWRAGRTRSAASRSCTRTHSRAGARSWARTSSTTSRGCSAARIRWARGRTCTTGWTRTRSTCCWTSSRTRRCRSGRPSSRWRTSCCRVTPASVAHSSSPTRSSRSTAGAAARPTWCATCAQLRAGRRGAGPELALQQGRARLRQRRPRPPRRRGRLGRNDAEGPRHAACRGGLAADFSSTAGEGPARLRRAAFRAGGRGARRGPAAPDAVRGAPRSAPDGGAPGRSIGVLTRTNAAVARMMLNLKDLGVHASEEGGNALTDAAPVVAILALLRMCDNPGNMVARYHVARTPLGASSATRTTRTTARRCSRPPPCGAGCWTTATA